MSREVQPQAVKEVPAEDFIKAYAAHLKSTDKLQIPDWVDVVKTACFKELPPLDRDWYYIRAAAIARQIYVRQGLGVGQLRIKFGGRNKTRGVKPEHFKKASGGLIRHIIKQLETVGFMEKHTGAKGGRRITPAGQKDMDLIAGRVTVRMPTLGFAVAAAPVAAE
ncbi:40S ribosomal protein S19-1 [Monoraphidium neglectum]|uniref:40S ribosomal protein S19-1 n=1 Tax=Monoraphidium neglectum TaxID=145388 RepID=A0A0D2N5E0_9CHLO|nr:40S ribosomal protein S19-1 [Monoraphidium neglectum]KIZ07512.1 40S ribosomal protein S19-1 [Monoraphidium neglectum]|eukprot:XP_013906531.1 40S ribosomal protein S19-1 [Monoraphidium neglectum]